MFGVALDSSCGGDTRGSLAFQRSHDNSRRAELYIRRPALAAYITAHAPQSAAGPPLDDAAAGRGRRGSFAYMNSLIDDRTRHAPLT